MTLALYFCITWFVIWNFIMIKNKIRIFENIYTFLMFLLIQINVYWIIIDELKKIYVQG